MAIELRVAEHNACHPDAAVSLRPAAGGLVLSFRGELDMKRSTDLGALMDQVLESCPPHRTIYLDLGEVSYISSTGIGLVTSCLTRGQKRSIEVVLVRLPAKVRNIFEALGVASFFRIEEGAPEAGAAT